MAEIAAGAAQGKRIEIWFEDEARIGQKNKITRRWARRGTRPSAPHDQRTRSAYIIGAICPKLDKAAALVMPWCDTHAMTQHLAEIARHVDEDAHAILIMDQAGWHMSNNLVVPENITILPLPPKSPELNPVENLWLFMRENWLSNRVFKSYDDIVDHCCHAWRKLESQPWRIMAIGRRKWANAFCISDGPYEANYRLQQKLRKFLRSKLVHRLLGRFPWLTFEQAQDVVPNHAQCMKGIVVRELHSRRNQRRDVLLQALRQLFEHSQLGVRARDYFFLERNIVLESGHESFNVKRKLAPAFM